MIRNGLRTRAFPSGDSESFNVYQWRGLRIDPEASAVTLHGQAVKLTGREWALLRALVKFSGQTVPVRRLLQEAWGLEYWDEQVYVRGYIGRLRRKLEADPKNPQYIVSEWGVGYRLVGPAAGLATKNHTAD